MGKKEGRWKKGTDGWGRGVSEREREGAGASWATGLREQAGASWAEVCAVRGGRSELGPRRGESWALVEKEWVGLS